MGFATESLPQIRRRGDLSARFRRASERLQGLTFALYPGENYVTSNPNCVSLRYILGVPNDDLLKALLVLDNGGPVARFKTFAKDRCGVEVVRHAERHGYNTEKTTPIDWYSFRTPSARTPADALRMPFRITDEDLEFIANRPQLCPSVERGHRNCPSSVLIRILERNGDGKLVRRELSKDEKLSDDELHALGWLYQQHRELNRDVWTVLIPARFLGGPCLRRYRRRPPCKSPFAAGSSHDAKLVLASERTGTSSDTKRRASRAATELAQSMCPGNTVDLLEYAARNAKATEDVENALDDSEVFDDGESLAMLHLLRTQTAYKELAARLKLKFRRRVLIPYGRLRKEVEVSEVKAREFTIQVDDNGSTRKARAWAWHVVDVFAELRSMLNDLYAYGEYEQRRFGEAVNCMWLLLGGDKGGSHFKFGFQLLNQAAPQSPDRVRLLAALGGVEDNRENLMLGPFQPEFLAQIDALKDCMVVHALGAYKAGPREFEYIHACVVMKEVPFSREIIEVNDAQVLEVPERDFDAAALAVEKDYVIGVVALQGVGAFLEAAFAAASPAFFAFVQEKIAGYLGEPFDARSRSSVVGVFPFAEPLAVANLWLAAEVLPLRRKLSGDWKFLCAMFGHMGANAMMPCPMCLALKAEMHSLGKLRTHESMIKDASANPLGWPDLCKHIADPQKRREAIMRNPLYTANDHHSMEFAPMTNIDPVKECSPAPTHQLIGTSSKILDYADDAIDELEGNDAEAAARTAAFVEKSKEAEKDVTVAECVKRDADLDVSRKEGAIARAEADVVRHQQRAAASKSARAREKARVEAGEAQASVTQLRSETESAKDVQAAADVELDKARSYWQKTVRDAQNASTAAPLREARNRMLRELKVTVDNYWQQVTGVGGLRLMTGATEFWDGLEAACPRHLLERFQAVRRKHEPLWTAIRTFSRAMLKVGNTLSKAEFAEVEEAAKVYQRIMTDIETKADGSEKDVNLKRHALHHILKMMKRHRTTGEFAESVWESMHARMNAVERAYSGMEHDKLRWAAAVRKAWLVMTHPKCRAAREQFKAARARK